MKPETSETEYIWPTPRDIARARRLSLALTYIAIGLVVASFGRHFVGA